MIAPSPHELLVPMEVVAVLFVAFSLILTDSYYTNKNNKKRYASILHRLKPGLRYPYWRLEEMLLEDSKKENE